MQRSSLNLPTVEPRTTILSQQKFNAGVITVVDQTNIPKNALKKMSDMVLVEDGVPTKRPGLAYYGNQPVASAIQGFGKYITSDGDPEIVIVSDEKVWRSQDDGSTWTECTGATFTEGFKVNFLQANSFLYIFNGEDPVARYDGTTTLNVYAEIDEPSGLGGTKTGLSGSSQTYYYTVVSINEVGHTLGSNVISVTTDRLRANFDASNYVTLAWTNPSGTAGTEIYVGLASTKMYYIDSTVGTVTSYVDKGQAPEQVAVLVPDANTTGGPIIGQLRYAGNRLVATQDKNNKERLWISGTGANIGSFSSAYDAAYIDFQKGTGLKTTLAEDYRDGKGTSLITVWCDTPDRNGCIWQGSLESYSVGDVTFLVPVFYKLPGSRGTNAAGSVVNVLNDWLFYNRQAMFNLGSRAQFLNLLSSDEITTNIRPNMKKIDKNASKNICSLYTDGTVYFSIPTTTSHNDTVMSYDTENKAWNPEAFTVGFEQMLEYTDTDEETIILAYKYGDTKLTQISEDFDDDYGTPIGTVLITGLFPVSKNRFDFIECETAEIEFAQHAGNTEIETYGVTREDGFRKIVDSMTVTTEELKYAWSNMYWSSEYWSDYTAEEGAVSSEPTKKIFFEVLQEINAYQFRITTSGTFDKYLLRTIQITGIPSEQGKAPNWQIF